MSWRIEGRYFENCSFGNEGGAPARLSGIFHPVGSELTIAKGDADTGLSAFGMQLDNGGKAGFSSGFAWAV